MHCHRTKKLFEDQRIPTVNALIIAFVVGDNGECVNTEHFSCN